MMPCFVAAAATPPPLLLDATPRRHFSRRFSISPLIFAARRRFRFRQAFAAYAFITYAYAALIFSLLFL